MGNIPGPGNGAPAGTASARFNGLLPNTAARDKLQAGLKEAGVPSAIYYPRPLHHQPAYAGAHDGASLPVSEDLSTRIMALPLHPDLTDQDGAQDPGNWSPGHFQGPASQLTSSAQRKGDTERIGALRDAALLSRNTEGQRLHGRAAPSHELNFTEPPCP